MNEEYMVDQANLKQIEATTSHTLLGPHYCRKEGQFDAGNCFSVLESDGPHHWRIVNFYLENLELLLAMKILTYPVMVYTLSEEVAIIHDARVPDRFYRKDYCTCCCPHNLLPFPQRCIHDLRVRNGEISHSRTSDGLDISSIKLKNKYDGCGIEQLIAGTWNELMANDRARKEAYIDAFNKAHDLLLG